MPHLKEILTGFDKLMFPAVPKSMIGSASELLKHMGHRVFDTKCYTYVLKDEAKLVERHYCYFPNFVKTTITTSIVLSYLG